MRNVRSAGIKTLLALLALALMAALVLLASPDGADRNGDVRPAPGDGHARAPRTPAADERPEGPRHRASTNAAPPAVGARFPRSPSDTTTEPDAARATSAELRSRLTRATASGHSWARTLAWELERSTPAEFAAKVEDWIAFARTAEVGPGDAAGSLLIAVARFRAGDEAGALDALLSGALSFRPVRGAFLSPHDQPGWRLASQLVPTFDGDADSELVGYYGPVTSLLPADADSTARFGDWLDSVMTGDTSASPGQRCAAGLWAAVLYYTQQLHWPRAVARLPVSGEDVTVLTPELQAWRSALRDDKAQHRDRIPSVISNDYSLARCMLNRYVIDYGTSAGDGDALQISASAHELLRDE